MVDDSEEFLDSIHSNVSQLTTDFKDVKNKFYSSSDHISYVTLEEVNMLLSLNKYLLYKFY